ncbi:ABC transporter permease subunit [Cellulomonas sp. HZM]|uniref:ABC transporter permease subunit n=1 Tax=Cellulomonas sp. HZM TaxID=1454010 RepID=UPI000493AB33|nr:ABC transporter permease subunit [Cellulomonas sp. HZM]
MRLVRVELSRFRARVLLWCVSAGMVGLAVVLVLTGWSSTRPPNAAELRDARTYYEQALEDWKDNGDQMLADCLDQQSQDPDPKADYGCSSMEPKLEQYLPYTPTLGDDGISRIREISLAVVLASALMAVSFVAAEFSTGAISNWLTFAPRRGRVYVSKVVAALLGVVPVAALTVLVAAGGTVLAFRTNGLADDVPAPVWHRLLDTSLRLLALAPMAALLGAALAFLLRHTAAVLGTLVGWAVLWEGIVGNTVSWARPYTLTLSINAWVRGGTNYSVEDCSTRDDAGMLQCTWVDKHLGMAQAGWQLVGVAVVLALVALVVFRRRDVG